MKPYEIAIGVILLILMMLVLWTTPCRPKDLHLSVKEIVEIVSDLENNIDYATYNKKKLYYELQIIRNIAKAHVKEAKGYSTTGNFHHWSRKHKPNPKIDFSEEP